MLVESIFESHDFFDLGQEPLINPRCFLDGFAGHAHHHSVVNMEEAIP